MQPTYSKGSYSTQSSNNNTAHSTPCIVSAKIDGSLQVQQATMVVYPSLDISLLYFNMLFVDT